MPEPLERARTAPDLYFDAVSRVRLPSWSCGRIALPGDAASCVSLFGDGSSLAMAGAYTLAAELAASPGDLGAALRRYEAAHRPPAEARQRGMTRAAAPLVPAIRRGILARNPATRLWPLGVAAAWADRAARAVGRAVR